MLLTIKTLLCYNADAKDDHFNMMMICKCNLFIFFQGAKVDAQACLV